MEDMKEIVFDFPTRAKYFATKDGQIYSEFSKRFLKPHLRPDGYLVVCIGRKQHYIHRLIAKTWIPNPNNLPEVNHKDEDKQKNEMDNLEWCDRHYNTHYGNFIEKSVHRGEDHPNATLTEQDVKAIRERYGAGEKVINIHRSYEELVGYHTIWKICHNKLWI